MTSDLILDLASGRKLDFGDPRPEAIVLEDIAGALSRICRFAAHASRFHSVAQHAVLVHDLVLEAGRPDLVAPALHHDSHEAYACDIPAPLKRRLEAAGETVYEYVCVELDTVIAAACGFERPLAGSEAKQVIKAADNAALLIEAAVLLRDGGAGIRETLERSSQHIQDSDRALGRSLDPPEAARLFCETARGCQGGGGLR